MNKIVHMTRGADLSGFCGYPLGVRGSRHVGWHTLGDVDLTGDVACGVCDMLVRLGRRPRHMADRESPQALAAEAVHALRMNLTGGVPRRPRHAAGVAA